MGLWACRSPGYSHHWGHLRLFQGQVSMNPGGPHPTASAFNLRQGSQWADLCKPRHLEAGCMQGPHEGWATLGPQRS